jgi:MSHA biogenesis protein MshO
MRRAAGFTLLELIVVLVLTGVLAGVLATVVSGPVRGQVEAGRRAALVDLAETALLRMTREIRLALPNSVRVRSAAGVTSLELLRIYDAGRYRAHPTHGPTPGCLPSGGRGDPLELACADAGFDVLGRLRRSAAAPTGADCAGGDGLCVVVYNTGQAGADAYAGDNRANLAGLSAGGADDGSDHILLTSPRLAGGQPAFPLASPGQRFFLVDGPVSFVCDPGRGTITRHQRYPISAAQSLAPGGSSALLVNQVAACGFTYTPGTPQRGGLATLRLTLGDPSLAEAVTLLQQVHVQNVP